MLNKCNTYAILIDRTTAIVYNSHDSMLVEYARLTTENAIIWNEQTETNIRETVRKLLDD